MEKLKGRTILLGREPGNARLLVAITDLPKGAMLGMAGSVPGSVSRCQPDLGKCHARIDVDPNGQMTVTNAKPENATYVNGNRIMSRHLNPADTVELGEDRFRLPLNKVFEAAGKLVDLLPKKFDISHLEGVWNELQDYLRTMKAKQKKVGMIRTGCGIFTMCAMPCMFFFGPIGYVLTGIGIIGNIYSFIGLKNDHSAEDLERFNEEFQDRYVCPNPDCQKFLGNMSYKLIKKQYGMHCPYCKCEYTENK